MTKTENKKALIFLGIRAKIEKQTLNPKFSLLPAVSLSNCSEQLRVVAAGFSEQLPCFVSLSVLFQNLSKLQVLGYTNSKRDG
jgi:hypothetical protein